MMTWVLLIAALLLFIAGVWLSAFFSGSETGFYRVSFLRLSIDAHAGDKQARQLMWFVQHPEFFVATTLVGNNIANYLTTLAIGIGADAAIGSSSALVDVGMTLLFAPAIFIFGELMPKNLYFRAPTRLLRRGLKLFRVFYRTFLPVSMPLVWITRLFEKLSGSKPHRMDLVLGRHRLMQVLSKGHEQGLLTSEQGQLIHGLLHDANRPVSEIMIPAARILGVVQGTDSSAILEFAREFGLTHVPLRTPEGEAAWTTYVRVVDLEGSQVTVTEKQHPMPRINHDATRLTALLTLRESGRHLGVVYEDESVVGIVVERSLIRHFMHPGIRPQTPAVAIAATDATASQ